jgi:hypothetical protein
MTLQREPCCPRYKSFSWKVIHYGW